MDESDQVFSILADPPKSIEVFSMNAAVSLPFNSVQTINWNTTGISNIKIEYATYFNYDFDNPNEWQTIASSVSASSGTYQWTIPDEGITFGRIRITDVSNSNVYDINDMDFSTYDPIAFPKNLEITSPNGGEILDSSSTWYNIAIKFENTYAAVEFQYTIDNGLNWIPIDTLAYNGFETTMFFPSFRTFNWKVPNVNSNQCKIRVRDISDNSIMDESDQVFSILADPPKSIEVLSMNASASLPFNSVQTINWNTTGISNIKIEYATYFNYDFDNPNEWQTIANSVSASSGTYQWTIPDEGITFGRMRITDVSNSNVYDINDMDFSTYDPVALPKDLERTSPNGGETLKGLTKDFNITLKFLNTYDELEFQYSIDNGANWIPVDTLVYNGFETTMFFPAFRTFNWKIPNVNSTQCKIRARLKADHSIVDQSDNVFTIVADTTSDVSEIDRQPQIKIYPNPSNNVINVESDSGIDGYEIYTVTGVLVLQKRNNTAIGTSINISVLPSGTHFINIYTSQGVVSSKIVKI